MKKYAIYSSETGYYYCRYFGALNELKGTPLENIVTPDLLPVVSDNKGGFFRFDDKDRNFVKLVSTNKSCPLPLEKMFFKNHPDFSLGWMSPQGDTYSCSYTGHSKAAEMICRKFFPESKHPELTLGKAGWIKIIDSWDGTERTHGQYVYSADGKLTKAQAEKLYDLDLHNNEEVRQLIERNSDLW